MSDISHHVQSGCGPNMMLPMHCTRASRLPPGNLRKPLEFLVFLHALQKGRTDSYSPILIVSQKPFKNLVKMNNSTVWPLPTAAQRASGPRHARAERGLRAKCATWESLKTIGKRCVFSGHHRCIGSTQKWTVLRRTARVRVRR